MDAVFAGDFNDMIDEVETFLGGLGFYRCIPKLIATRVLTNTASRNGESLKIKQQGHLD